MFRKAATPKVAFNPIKVIRLIKAMTPYVVVDDTLTTGKMREIVFKSRGLRAQEHHLPDDAVERLRPQRGRLGGELRQRGRQADRGRLRTDNFESPPRMKG